MFWRKGLFGKRTPDQTDASPDAPPDAPPDPPLAPEFPDARPIGPGLMRTGSGEPDPDAAFATIVRFLMAQYKDERGIHAETLLNAVGALAGFSAQEAIWEGVVRPGKMPADAAFTRIDTQNGSTYYVGDFLNMILASETDGQLSIWRLVAGAAVQNGAVLLPHLPPLFDACARSIGGAQFGVPAWAGQGALQELPWDALRHWPVVRAILDQAQTKPLHWPLEIARAAQTLMDLSKDLIDPAKAALIVMEAAIPMSKVDPKLIPGGTMVD